MIPPDTDVLSLLGDIVKWLSAPMFGLIAWAWSRNQKEHDDMALAQRNLQAELSKGHSKLNDRIMEHIDDQVREVRLFVIAEDTKLMAELGTQRGHIGKIFDKMEIESKRREDQHIETIQAIHALSNTMHQALAGKADK